MNRRKLTALAAIPAMLIVGATAASAAAAWHTSGAGHTTVVAGTWTTSLPAPTGFTFMVSCSGGSGTGTATAAWSAVAGATGYKVIWGTSATLVGATTSAVTTSPYTGITVGSVTHHAPEYAEVEATAGAIVGTPTAWLNVVC